MITRGRAATMLAAAVLIVGFTAPSSFAKAPGGGSGGGTTVAYSSIPARLPGNVASVGFEATQTTQFGDEVGLSSTSGRSLQSVKVVMSSWACESGSVYAGTCSTTTPGAYFTVPITVNLYAVGGTTDAPVPGAALAAKTQSFNILYRPTSDPVNCPQDGAAAGSATAWYDPTDSTCYHGLAQVINFSFAGKLTLPSKVIWTVAFNTTHYGANPYGENTSCFGTSQGCGYDSLNVGSETIPDNANPPLVGTDVQPGGVFQASTWTGEYCDGGAATGSLRYDAGDGIPVGTSSTACGWADYRPLAQISTK